MITPHAFLKYQIFLANKTRSETGFLTHGEEKRIIIHCTNLHKSKLLLILLPFKKLSKNEGIIKVIRICNMSSRNIHVFYQSKYKNVCYKKILCKGKDAETNLNHLSMTTTAKNCVWGDRGSG